MDSVRKKWKNYGLWYEGKGVGIRVCFPNTESDLL